jgi:release factor glutamine methyltransferase
MDDLEQIAHCATSHLQPGGWLLMEHGYDQGKFARKLLKDTGFKEVIDHTDDAGQDRVIAGRR